MEHKVIDLQQYRPQYYLITPSGEILGRLDVSEQTLNLSLTDLSTLKLTVPISSFLAIEKINDVYQLVEKNKNKLLEYIGFNQIEMVDYKGNQERFFIKTKKITSGSTTTVELDCVSLAYELSYKTLSVWKYNKFKGNWNPNNGYPQGNFVPGSYWRIAENGVLDGIQYELGNFLVYLGEGVKIDGRNTMWNQVSYIEDDSEVILSIEEVVEDILQGEDWKLKRDEYGTPDISPSLVHKYRTFETVEDTNKLALINDVAEKFSAIVHFDTINKTISFYSLDDVAKFDESHISFLRGQLMDNLTVDERLEEIFTVAKPFAKDVEGNEIDISSLNPLGLNQIEYYGFFINGFDAERDENGKIKTENNVPTNVYSSSPYMSDELCAALINQSIDLEQMINDSYSEHKALFEQYSSKTREYNLLQNDIIELENEKDVLQKELERDAALEEDVEGKLSQETRKQYQRRIEEINKILYEGTEVEGEYTPPLKEQLLDLEKEISRINIRLSALSRRLQLENYLPEFGNKIEIKCSNEDSYIKVNDELLENIQTGLNVFVLKQDLELFDSGYFQNDDESLENFLNNIPDGYLVILLVHQGIDISEETFNLLKGYFNIGFIREDLNELSLFLVAYKNGAKLGENFSYSGEVKETFYLDSSNNPYILELKNFRREKVLKNDSINDAEELWEWAREELLLAHAGFQDVSFSVVLPDDERIEELLDELRPGITFYIYDKTTNLDTGLTLSEVTIDFSSFNITTKFTTTPLNEADRLSKLERIFKQSIKTANTVTTNQKEWKLSSKRSKELSKRMTQAIDAATRQIIAGGKGEIVMDDYGITIYAIDEAGNINKNRHLKITNGVIAINDGSGFGYRTAITPDGIHARNIVGQMIWGDTIEGHKLSIEHASGRIKLDEHGISVTDDRNVKVFSVDPSGNAYFKGDISGSSGTFGNIRITEKSIFAYNNQGEKTFEINENGNVTVQGNITGSSMNIGGHIYINDEGIVAYNTSDENEQGEDNKTFEIKSDGTVKVKGEINATSGRIGGFVIQSGALKDDNESILIEGGKITIFGETEKENLYINNSSDYIIYHKNFYIDRNGNVVFNGSGHFNGDISGSSAQIGNLYINKHIQNENKHYAMYVVNSNGVRTFSIDDNGEVIVSGNISGSRGTIGGITFDNNGITSDNFSVDNEGKVIMDNFVVRNGVLSGLLEFGTSGRIGIGKTNNGLFRLMIDKNGIITRDADGRNVINFGLTNLTFSGKTKYGTTYDVLDVSEDRFEVIMIDDTTEDGYYKRTEFLMTKYGGWHLGSYSTSTGSVLAHKDEKTLYYHDDSFMVYGSNFTSGQLKFNVLAENNTSLYVNYEAKGSSAVFHLRGSTAKMYINGEEVDTKWFSSKNAKRNIKDFVDDGKLDDFLENIKLKEFEYIPEIRGGRKSIGFIIEDLEEMDNELAKLIINEPVKVPLSNGRELELKTYEAAILENILLAIVQKQHFKIKELEERIERLESKLK